VRSRLTPSAAGIQSKKAGTMIEPSNAELAELPDCSRQYILDLENNIAALRAAAEQMAKQLRSIRALAEEAETRGEPVNGESFFSVEDAAALEAWEQVSK
jgi:hypothetical protein